MTAEKGTTLDWLETGRSRQRGEGVSSESGRRKEICVVHYGKEKSCSEAFDVGRSTEKNRGEIVRASAGCYRSLSHGHTSGK